MKCWQTVFYFLVLDGSPNVLNPRDVLKEGRPEGVLFESNRRRGVTVESVETDGSKLWLL